MKDLADIIVYIAIIAVIIVASALLCLKGV